MNTVENIFKNFGFQDEDIIEILNYFSLKQYKNGEFFIKYGQTGEYLGIIERGIFQYYYENETDELTTYIAFKNDFIISFQSFYLGKPSKENIKAIINSEVWLIRKTDFEKLNNIITGFKDFYIKALENLVICIDESRFDYITLKPEERYLKLLNEEPQLLQQIPLKHLSAIIGITPRHLSRIRSNIR
jgi:CRP/FNR family transcriptional regulator, anaerobic regulatory protein